MTQSMVDLMETFGWRPSRQDPLTTREDATNPLQPSMLANGVVAHRVCRLSDQTRHHRALLEGTIGGISDLFDL